MNLQAVACVLSISLGWLSDRYRSRSLVIISCAPLAAAGFFMLEFLPASRPWAKYGAVYLALPPLYASLPIWMTWVSGSLLDLSNPILILQTKTQY